MERGGARRHLTIRGWCADLTMSPLPPAAFDLVVVTRYLQRDLFPSLRGAVRPGGCVDLRDVHRAAAGARHAGRRRPIICSTPGELRASFDGWDVLFCEEVEAPKPSRGSSPGDPIRLSSAGRVRPDRRFASSAPRTARAAARRCRRWIGRVRVGVIVGASRDGEAEPFGERQIADGVVRRVLAVIRLDRVEARGGEARNQIVAAEEARDARATRCPLAP